MLYRIHRYPTELIDIVHLASGQRVVVRPVLPQDRDLTGAFFRDLRATSRYHRFLSPMRSLSPDLLTRFTQVDYADHLALMAEVFHGDREIVIAEARYVRGADRRSAELAVSVADAWQRQGLASLLLGKLVRHAATAGITRIHGETLAGNDKMLRLARKGGFAILPSQDIAGLLLLEKIVQSPAEYDSCRA